MDNTIVQKIKEELTNINDIAIAVGKDPSIDEMAAALSLFLLLKKANKKVVISCPTQPIVELSNLVGINKVQNNLSSQDGDLVVSFPYVEGEIEKVSYTLENGKLNIIVKAAGNSLSFDEKDVIFTKGGQGFKLLFVVGTPVLSDLGHLIQPEKMRDAKIINIDNKRENQGFGDIVAVSPAYSSVSELVADILLSLGFQVDQDSAQNLLSGIIYSTKNFQDPKTTPIAFEIASFLMRNGAIRQIRNSTPTYSNEDNFHQQQRHQAPQSTQSSNTTSTPIDNSQSNMSNGSNQQAPNDWLAPKVYKGSSNF